MATGTIKFYNQKSKFGFIIVDEDSSEIYFKKSGMIDLVDEGNRVEFDIEPSKKGPKGINVRLLKA